MPLAAAHKKAAEELIANLANTTSSGRGKRKLGEMFMLLPDRETWADYYKVVRRPRCFQGIQDNLAKGNYSSAHAVWEDLNLIFDNALLYNEEQSQIAQDAVTLKKALSEAWLGHAVLPKPRQLQDPPPTKTNGALKSSPTRSQATAPDSAAAAVALVPEVIPDYDADADMPGTPVSTTEEFPAREDEVGEIIEHLESGLPRWPGPGDDGWVEDPSADYLYFAGVLTALRGYKDPSGHRPIDTLDQVEEETADRNLSFSEPLSIQLIEARARTKHYASAKDFDRDMARLFEKARRWHEDDPTQYGKLLVCQRLYQELVATLSTHIPSTSSNFASIPAGPLSAQATQNPADPNIGMTSFEIATEGRVFTESVRYKGWTLRAGDWVHLMNPDDASKPIVAQVWKTFTKEDDSSDEKYLTVCWYFRPEQTYHPPHRQFWENELFKTAYFVEHNVRDVLEKVCVQFTPRYVKGRPRGPFWYPGWPLYVCDSRFVAHQTPARFSKIHNWRACVPPEIRAVDVPLYAFERPVYPRLLQSPFTRGVRGPGAIVDPTLHQPLHKEEEPVDEGGTIARRRPRRVPGGATPTKSALDKEKEREEPPYAGPTHGTRFPLAYGTGKDLAVHKMGRKGAGGGAGEERTVIGAAGGAANIQGHAIVELLPPETTKLFDRDPETNQILWFSGPPVDMAHSRPPQHSLAYLDFLASKRKKRESGEEEDSPVNGHTEKKQRLVPISMRAKEAWAKMQEAGEAPMSTA
ncbi:hypothetical protein EXIGLDRAFT_685606, partial [Exidia glandulosa HHB12029]